MPTIRKPIFVAPLDLGTVTTGNAASGYPATNLNRQRDIGLVWKSSGASNLWVRCNLGSLKAISFVALLAANALTGTTIRVRLGTSQAEVDGTAPYDSGVLPFPGTLNEGDGPALTLDFVGDIYLTPFVGLSSNGVFHSHLELERAVNAQWLRIDLGGHTGDFQAAKLVVGKKLEPSRYYNYGFERGGKDLGKIDIGRLGVVDEEPGIKLRTLDFTLGWQTEEEYETKFRPMAELIGETAPVYVCFDPTATAYRGTKTYFGFLKNPAYARGSRKVATYEQNVSMLSLI